MLKNKIYIEESQIPMCDLGAENENLNCIFSVEYDKQDIKDYMSDYYYNETSVQSQSYDLVEQYKRVFNNTFSTLGGGIHHTH